MQDNSVLCVTDGLKAALTFCEVKSGITLTGDKQSLEQIRMTAAIKMPVCFVSVRADCVNVCVKLQNTKIVIEIFIIISK